MLAQAGLDFVADRLHDHVLGAAHELAVLRDELFEDGALGHVFFRRTLGIRQRRDSLCAGAQSSLVVDLRPQLQEELQARD